jgi:ABC-type transporter MlaC component
LARRGILCAKRDGRWLIEDILLDGVSLRLDLRSQTQKILREESYE